MSEYSRYKVRRYHLDQDGHMNVSAYNSFMEEARWQLFENYNSAEFFSELDLSLILVNTNINYYRPCKLGDALEVQTKVMQIGQSSCKVEQSIMVDGDNKRVAVAEHVFVLMDMKTVKARPIEGKAREKLEQLAQAF